jgi:hypothetical protein
MTLSKLRRWLYKGQRALGDVQAVRRGRLAQRLTNRIIGRAVGWLLRKVWR